jgi:hypothetical protein
LAVQLARSGNAAAAASAAAAAASNSTTADGDAALAATPVLAKVMHHWGHLQGILGAATAWRLLSDVAAVEVATPAQWQRLAAWAFGLIDAGGGASLPPEAAAALSRSWSGLEWTAAHGDAVCARLTTMVVADGG